MSDWIEWHGGQPVPDGTRVEIIFRDGDISYDTLRAEELRWSHKGWDGDIVKYRVVGYDPCTFSPSSKSISNSRIGNMKQEVKGVLAKYRTPMQVAGSHYTSMTVEPIDIAYLNDLSAMQLKVLKYVLRYKDKGGVEDLKKAREMLSKAAAYEYGVNLAEDD